MSQVKILMRTVLLGVFALALSVIPATAFLPPSDSPDHYAVPLPAVDPHDGGGFAGLTASRAVATTLQARYGGSWQVLDWSAHSNTPRWVYGPAVRVAAAITTEAQLEQVARQVVSANYDVLRADLEDLRLVHAPRGMGKWVAHLQQYWHGHEVLESKVRLVFHDNGNLMIMGSTFYRDIDLDPHPALSAGAAADAAIRDLPYQPELGDRYVVEPALLVLPVATSGNTVEHHLVYRVRVDTAQPLGEWVTHVDAHSGDVIWRYNNVHFDFMGSATNIVQPESYCAGQQTDPASYLNLNVSGAGATTTNIDGAWQISGGGASGTVTATLQGPYVRVYNYNGADAAFSSPANAGEPFVLSWSNTNSRQDERDVFDGVNRIHKLFLHFDPTFPYVNTPINAYVNRTDGYCPGNAWWNGTINFCAAGSGYANTGEIQQVVEHEFGHGIQDALLGGTQGDQGLGEGNSDILGNLITQESIIGRGFYQGNCTSGIRNALNTLRYPGDVIGQPIHSAGQVIAGFHWDAMVALQAQYGQEEGTIKAAERWHYARKLLQPMTQPDQVVATFITDDDNGDLDDGTPHHAIFAQAAANHGFDDFVPEILVGMFIYHTTIPYQTNQMGPYTVAATGASLGGGDVDPHSFELHYRLDGGAWNAVAMDQEGGAFVGLLPGQLYGTVCEYYISGRNTLGSEGTSPRTAPDALHYFEINTQFEDTMETATAWIGGLPTDTATTGLWERGIPQQTTYNGNVVQLGSDHTPPPGVNCWVTGATAGSGAGSFDVDGGYTTLLSPVIDLTGGTNVQISYWRYYTNTHGANPGIDYWRVQISNDGGQTWSFVENTNQSDTGWVQVSFPLSNYFASPGLVQMRFIADDAPPNGSLVEAMVDDFLLVGEFPPTAVDDLPPVRVAFSLEQNHPNPFNPSTQVGFSLERGGRASLRVFDARGRLVKSLISAHLPAGQHSATWNGLDDRGQPAPSGVYFYRLESSGQKVERRMLLVK